MSEIRNRAASIVAPTVPSAGSVTDPFSGSPFPRSTHPALQGGTGSSETRIADVSKWADMAAKPRA